MSLTLCALSFTADRGCGRIAAMDDPRRFRGRRTRVGESERHRSNSLLSRFRGSNHLDHHGPPAPHPKNNRVSSSETPSRRKSVRLNADFWGQAYASPITQRRHESGVNMARRDHVSSDAASHTAAIKQLTRPRCTLLEPLIVVFLLFFAVLAFAWFYVQRAKARTTTTTPATSVERPHETDAVAPPIAPRVDRPE